MLNVQNYLLSHSLADLIREHGVYHRFSSQNPKKFSLSYDQLEAKDGDPIVEECRGLILRTQVPTTNVNAVVGQTEVMALPMGRFYNFGQGAAAPVDMNSPDTYFCEKLDGTLCIVYNDPDLGKFCVATRSVPDADLPMDGFGTQTFSDLFWKAFLASGGTVRALCNFMSKQNATDITFCFELCTPDNQVVVKYNDYRVYLLAVRDWLGSEYAPEQVAAQLHLMAAPTFHFGNTEEMINFVSSRNPSTNEGIVVCQRRGTSYSRVKVKNPGYMALSKIRDSVAKSPRAVMEIILLGQEDDVMPLVPPHVQEVILATKASLRGLLTRLDAEYVAAYHPDRKTFALAIQAGSGMMGPQMARWSGKCSSTHGWIMSARKDGTWSDSLLDTLLRMSKVETP